MIQAHKVILLLVSIGLLTVSCKAFSDKQNSAETVSGDEESDQPSNVVFQQLYESGKFQRTDNNYALFELRGPVKSVSYSGDNMGIPFESVTFADDGMLDQIEYSSWGGKSVSRYNMEFDDKNRLTTLNGDPFEAHFTYRGKSRGLAKLKIHNQEDGLDTYYFLYDKDNTLTDVERYTELGDDYANQDRRKEMIRYSIKDLTKDHYGNWTKREIRSNRGDVTTVTRKINYIDPPQLVSIESKNNLFCYTTTEYDAIILYTIDKQTNRLSTFAPPENDAYWGYKDIKVVGDRLYAIVYTGACGAPGHDCDVYYYDTSDESWHYIINCGGDCEFVDGRIKAPIYVLTKEGSCTAENEYDVVNKWIDLE